MSKKSEDKVVGTADHDLQKARRDKVLDDIRRSDEELDGWGK